jgi:GR25 family glycosyltransferase involved in LPS biosynthesis
MKIKCFVIHLERATERLAQVKAIKESNSLVTEVVHAVDGKSLTPDGLKCYVPRLHLPAYPFPLGIGESACFLSHRACWQRIIDENLDAGLIVEDDLQIDKAVFTGAYELVLTHFTNDLYVRFPVKRREAAKEVVTCNHQFKLFLPEVIGLKTTAQLVGIEAARRLLAASKSFDRPVDTFLQMRWIHGVSIYAISPAGVSENDLNLGGSSIQKKVSLFNKFSREIQRFIYRHKINKLSSRIK